MLSLPLPPPPEPPASSRRGGSSSFSLPESPSERSDAWSQSATSGGESGGLRADLAGEEDSGSGTSGRSTGGEDGGK